MKNSAISPWLARSGRFILPLIIVAISVFVAQYLMANKPEAKKRPQAKSAKVQVEVVTLSPQPYQVKVASFGTISPRSQGALVSQVASTVNSLSDSFAVGGFFEQGDVLLTLDQRDFKAAKSIADASLVEAKLALAEEQARAAQAKRDWQRLGKGSKANELVLRKPQLAAAQAAVSSAKAKLEQAKLDLERTVIRAPYAGRVLQKHVDLGQFINSGTQLANIYAVDYVEVRLPLNSSQQAVIDLPELYRQGQAEPAQPQVTIAAQFGRDSFHWQGQIVRTEGALDTNSRQLYAIARIDDPYGVVNQDKPPLKIGQFVDAKITGKTLQNVFVLPRHAVYQSRQVIVFENGTLQRKDVSVRWADDEHFVIDSGLTAGQMLVTTPLGNVISGTQAKLATESP
ncbi:efflux RND transporter periplasmic adaptor subunit [Motilimonas pumila]|uniref:Efflux RND transporter periplasmic adaptor subunit n=1 Tax=Motilimonas pumila TaxID=2303987 RepID=A0A418YHK5_9GAMM|nr:efflux RND transporter periplasmic adaptor subunit [Motilimonas pumila]RJG49439.1 efflux RND transporter periplasmic adaptor subunit [Motilimonas pumila]